MVRLLALIALVTSLSGCYRTWPELDAFAATLSCASSERQVRASAQRYQANIIPRDEFGILQIQKEADTVAIRFDKQGRIRHIAVAKTDILLFGLHRRRLDAKTLLTCSH